MNRYKEYFAKGALWLWAMFFWCASIAAGESLAETGGQVQLRYSQPQLTAEQLDQIAKEEEAQGTGLTFAAWNQKAATVESALGRSTEGQVLRVYGRSQHIFPTVPLLQGRWVTSQEESTCMVSRDMAQQLWGSYDVLGLSLTVEGTPYTVAGIVDKDMKMVVLPSGRQGVFDSITLTAPKGGSTSQTAENFAMRAGLPDGYTMLFAVVPWGISTAAQNLLPWAAALWLAFCLWRQTKKEPVPAKRWAGFGAAALVTAALLWVLGFPWKIPGEMVPTRWSDFSFWGRLCSLWSTRFSQAVLARKFLPDIPLWHAVGKSVAFMLFSVVLWLVLAAVTIKRPPKRPVPMENRFLLCGAVAVASWGLCLLIFGKAPADRKFLFLPPFVWATGCFLNLEKRQAPHTLEQINSGK